VLWSGWCEKEGIEKGERGGYRFVDGLVFLEDLGVSSRGPVVEDFRLCCGVGVRREGNYPCSWDLDGVRRLGN